MLGVDSRFSTPKKVKSKSKGVTIQVPSNADQPKKRMSTRVLKVIKKKTSKPKSKNPKKTVKLEVNEEEVVVNTEQKKLTVRLMNVLTNQFHLQHFKNKLMLMMIIK